MTNEQTTFPFEKEPISSSPQMIEQYIIGKTIGEGTFGKVKIGVHSPTQEKVAIKILEKDKIIDEGDIMRVAREINILKKIKHNFVIQLYQIIETSEKIYLVMEYASKGELFDHIVQNIKLSEQEACQYYRQLIQGIDYIHKLKIVHRDLKPENLLLDHNNKLKIVDFGLSNLYKHDQKLKTACGSPCYAAPEMIAGQVYDGLQVDIWSSGVILFAMIFGQLPFEDPDTTCLYQKIIDGDFTIPDSISIEGRDLLLKILDTNPNERYTISEIKQHPWYNQLEVNEKEVNGIIYGLDEIKINKFILNKLQDYNIDVLEAEKDIKNNVFNNNTATYQLLLRNFLDGGNQSLRDVTSLKNNYKINISYMQKVFSPQKVDKSTPNKLKIVKRNRYYKDEQQLFINIEKSKINDSEQIQVRELYIVPPNKPFPSEEFKAQQDHFRQQLAQANRQRLQNQTREKQLLSYKLKQIKKQNIDKFLINYDADINSQFHNLQNENGYTYSVHIPRKVKSRQSSLFKNQNYYFNYQKMIDGKSFVISGQDFFKKLQSKESQNYGEDQDYQIPLVEISKSKILPKLSARKSHSTIKSRNFDATFNSEMMIKTCNHINKISEFENSNKKNNPKRLTIKKNIMNLQLISGQKGDLDDQDSMNHMDFSTKQYSRLNNLYIDQLPKFDTSQYTMEKSERIHHQQRNQRNR